VYFPVKQCDNNAKTVFRPPLNHDGCHVRVEAEAKAEEREEEPEQSKNVREMFRNKNKNKHRRLNLLRVARKIYAAAAFFLAINSR
jgi:hypothetical protein